MIKVKNVFTTSETTYAVDRKGKIVAWNPAAEKTFGFTEKEALGRSCWELLSGQDLFGNPLCCVGCPIRDSAFNNIPVNRFQIYFKSASNQFRKFTVSTMMLSTVSDESILVHLCIPTSETEITGAGIKPYTSNHLPLDYQYKKLTHRETEVLFHMHKGESIEGIADNLNISPSTVRNHVQHILLKLRVHSRYEAVAIGRKLDLI